jgi:hypothetical protein
VVLGTALELWLIPLFQASTGNGGLGVVVSFVVCEVLLCGALLLLMPKGTMGARVFLDGSRAIAAALVTAVGLRLLAQPSPWLGIPLCILGYTLASAAVGLVRPDDLRALLRLFGARSGRSAGTSAVEPGPTPLP